MTIKYFADIRNIAGCEDEALSSPAPTLCALLGRLCHAHPGLAQRFFKGEGLDPMITILVNGRNVVHLAGLDTPLGQDDVIAIFPMVAGG